MLIRTKVYLLTFLEVQIQDWIAHSFGNSGKTYAQQGSTANQVVERVVSLHSACIIKHPMRSTC